MDIHVAPTMDAAVAALSRQATGSQLAHSQIASVFRHCRYFISDLISDFRFAQKLLSLIYDESHMCGRCGMLADLYEYRWTVPSVREELPQQQSYN